MADHAYVESGSGFCARCDDMPGEGEHATPFKAPVSLQDHTVTEGSVWMIGYQDPDLASYAVVDEDFGWAPTCEEVQLRCDGMNLHLKQKYAKEEAVYEARRASDLATYQEKLLDHQALIAFQRPSKEPKKPIRTWLVEYEKWVLTEGRYVPVEVGRMGDTNG